MDIGSSLRIRPASFDAIFQTLLVRAMKKGEATELAASPTAKLILRVSALELTKTLGR